MGDKLNRLEVIGHYNLSSWDVVITSVQYLFVWKLSDISEANDSSAHNHTISKVKQALIAVCFRG
jgi:hypothetical protein